jgi:TPR repeat protein
MIKLAGCYFAGAGVIEDYAQAAVWLQKAADLGNAASKATVGSLFLTGDAPARVVKDAARGF